MERSTHYDLKKIYYGLLEKDPDYPAWQDFEWKDTFYDKWERLKGQVFWYEQHEYRYNPLSKKWVPVGGWLHLDVLVSGCVTYKDEIKIQSYATRLSFESEIGMVTDEKWNEMVKNGEV